METCQRRPSKRTVAFLMTPSTGRDMRAFTQPSFGSQTQRPFISTSWGQRIPGEGPERLFRLGWEQGKPGEHFLHGWQLGGLVMVADPDPPFAGLERIPALGEHPVPKEPQGMAPGEERLGLRRLRLELEAIRLEAKDL